MLITIMYRVDDRRFPGNQDEILCEIEGERIVPDRIGDIIELKPPGETIPMVVVRVDKEVHMRNRRGPAEQIVYETWVRPLERKEGERTLEEQMESDR